jgi:hypothetical protein
MAANYSLRDFIEDLERITRTETSQETIVGAAKPLLAKLVQQPDCIVAKYRKRGATAYGRYKAHGPQGQKRTGRRVRFSYCVIWYV